MSFHDTQQENEEPLDEKATPTPESAPEHGEIADDQLEQISGGKQSRYL